VDRRLAFVLAAATGAILCTSSSGTSLPFAPLSSLGRLQPAPYPGDPGPELVPVPHAPRLASPVSRSRPGKSVDGIRCEFNPRLVSHVHVHLTVFVNGKPRTVPAGIGFWPPLGPQNYRRGQFGVAPGSCWSSLSTRYGDGLIHVESPTKRSFVLGELFDIWGQPLSRSAVGPAQGPVTAIVDRRVWTGDPRRIPLRPHAQIQLEVGKPLVAPQEIDFPGAF
jgi:hypothetical protein